MSEKLPSIGIQAAIATPILESARAFIESAAKFGEAASLFSEATKRFEAVVKKQQVCRWCEHYSGRITGEYGACLLHGWVMAPFDKACDSFKREVPDGYCAGGPAKD